MLLQAHYRKGIYWHIFPTRAEAKNAIWRDPVMLFDVIPPDLIEKTNETELVVYLKCGSIIQLMGSDDPDSLRGAGPCGVIFDEFDTQKGDGWMVVEPILRANNGWAWFIGTPRGRAKLYDFYQRGQSGHKEWGSTLLRADKSGIISDEQLLETRRSMTEQMYRQEMLCEFLEAQGSVFRGVKEVMISEPQDPTKPENQQKLYVMGVDLAKVQDYTVIRVYDRETNSLVYSDRFKTLEWPFQKRRIAATAQRFNKALTVIDATGLGDPIADDLIRAGVSILPFKLTEQSKKDIIEKLSIWIEQRKIKLLYQADALLEYENFSYEMGPTGKVRYEARPGYHDDIVCFVKGIQILTNKGQIPIEQVKIGDMVMTRKGYMPIIATHSSIKKIIINRYLQLIGTPDHPVITTKGIKRLDSITNSDKIHIWNPKQLCIEEKTITDIQTPTVDISRSIIGTMINGNNHLLHYIDKYGWIILEKYLRGILSTTKTRIPSTMISLILNYLNMENITDSTCLNQNNGRNQLPMVSYNQQDWFGNLKNGKKKILNKSINKMLNQVNDWLVKLISNDGVIIKEKVYNITVANQPEYFANNILVHNCADALAVWHLAPVMIPEFTKEPTRIQSHYAKMVKRYETNKDSQDEDAEPDGQSYSEWGDMPF